MEYLEDNVQRIISNKTRDSKEGDVKEDILQIHHLIQHCMFKPCMNIFFFLLQTSHHSQMQF